MKRPTSIPFLWIFMCGLNGIGCFLQCIREFYWLALVSAMLAGAAMAFAIIEFKEVIKR